MLFRDAFISILHLTLRFRYADELSWEVHFGYADELSWKMWYPETCPFLFCMVFFCILAMSCRWTELGDIQHLEMLVIDVHTIFRVFWVGRIGLRPFWDHLEVSKGFRTVLRGFALIIVEFVHWFIARSLTDSPRNVLGFSPKWRLEPLFVWGWKPLLRDGSWWEKTFLYWDKWHILN